VELRHWHPTEDDLILHFYGEGQPDSEARIDDHLRGCADCRAAWRELSGTLKLVDAARLPEAPSGFEHVMWARVEQALMRAPVVPRRSIWTMRGLVPLGAMAALVVTAVTLGVLSLRRPVTSDVPATGGAASTATKPDYTRERMLLTALDDHFEQTEVLLVELLNAPEGEGGDLDFERTTADDLVLSGRLSHQRRTDRPPARGADARGPRAGARRGRQEPAEDRQVRLQVLAVADCRRGPAPEGARRRQ
jgi:hypothetical protein